MRINGSEEASLSGGKRDASDENDSDATVSIELATESTKPLADTSASNFDLNVEAASSQNVVESETTTSEMSRSNLETQVRKPLFFFLISEKLPFLFCEGRL